MKLKFYLLALSVFLVFNTLDAQKQSTLDIALRHFEKEYKTQGLNETDIKDMVLSSSFISKKTGATYLYLNQTIDGILIKNAIANIVVNKEGKVVVFSNTFVKNAKNIAVKSSNTLSAQEALTIAAKQLGVASPDVSFNRYSEKHENEYVFDKSNISNSDIVVRPMYVKNNDRLELTWESTIDMKSNSDYWEYYINATTGDFISKNNLTVYCTHEKGKYHNHDKCEISQVSDFKLNQTNVRSITKGASAYNVLAIPAESPIHGQRQIVVDPAYPEASPYGWHDTDGDGSPNYTITRGNNVHAYEDKDDNNLSDGFEPDGGVNLNFDFPLSLTNDPRDSKDAAVTNLFYMVNMMHDVSYLYGFDEAAGNFQETNFSGEGDSGDEVNAEAFDGITLHESGADGANPKINNANFSTPRDGNSGRMQMFFWDNQVSSVYINSPSSIEGFILEYGTGDFGFPIPTINDAPVTGKVAIARDGTPGASTQNCKPVQNTDEVNGNIALVDRGLCDFSLKAYNAQQAGAIALLICNVTGVNGGDGDEIINMTGGDNATEVVITSIFMKKSDCDRIKLAINSGEEVIMTLQETEETGPQYIDGALDNGVIAHEFGHGISTRLVGGPDNVGCLGNEEQMGEGWSDFFSLALTAETGDQGSDRRGIGNFASGSNTEGRGIRRFPYSTDMNVCPLTFDDIKTGSVPHGVGEIWAATLWDLYWGFVDIYGFDQDLTNKESGNARAIELVIEALKLTPCQPGFVGGRFGIFKADELLYDGEHACLIWDVFARRGLGVNANQGESDNVQDGIENFESNPVCLKKHKIVQIDAQGGRLTEAGDVVNLRVDVTNYVGETRENLIAKVELPDGVTYIDGSAVITYGFYENGEENNFIPDEDTPKSTKGNNRGTFIEFEVGTLEQEKTAMITFDVVSDSDKKSSTVFLEDMEQDLSGEWEYTLDEGFEAWGPVDFYSNSGLYSQYIFESELETDASIITPSVKLVGDNPVLRFYHRFETEAGNDGGFIMVSNDGGDVWNLMNDNFFRNPYNSTLQYSTFAIPNLRGFSGSSNDFIDSYMDLHDFKGEDVKLRFRFGTNETIASTASDPGWFVDDIEVIDMIKYPLKACIIDDGTEECIDMDDILINSNGILGTNDAGERFGLEVYPNPADDYITIALQSTKEELVDISLVSMDGKVILQTKIRAGISKSVRSLDTSNVLPGIYTLKLESNQALKTEKVVIF